MVNCPICGKNCKNAFYLGRHVSQKSDSKHTYDQDNSKPDLSDSISDSSGSKEDVNPEPDNSGSGSSQVVEWDKEETKEDNFRELDSNDPMESKLISKGHSEINMETEEVR